MQFFEKFNADSFLPNHKKLKVGSCCLGIYSRLFEEKRSLTHLELVCSHISTDSSHQSNWVQVTDLCQNLQELSIFSTVNLFLIRSVRIIHRLSQLKKVRLPSKLIQKSEQKMISWFCQTFTPTFVLSLIYLTSILDGFRSYYCISA